MVKFEVYTQMPSTPAGAILDNILKRLGVSQAAVARGIGLVPQRIYDLIKGNRRFTPELSIAVEKFLNIDIPGLFYLSQANHDIFLAKSHLNSFPNDVLSALNPSIFWEMDINKLDINRDKSFIILRVMEYGADEDLQVLMRLYDKDEIISVSKSISAPRNQYVLDRNLKYISSK